MAQRITCPICKTELPNVADDFPHRPFCSQRCKLADLHNWLTGAYRISTPLGPNDHDDEEIELS